MSTPSMIASPLLFPIAESQSVRVGILQRRKGTETCRQELISRTAILWPCSSLFWTLKPKTLETFDRVLHLNLLLRHRAKLDFRKLGSTMDSDRELERHKVLVDGCRQQITRGGVAGWLFSFLYVKTATSRSVRPEISPLAPQLPYILRVPPLPTVSGDLRRGRDCHQEDSESDERRSSPTRG